MPKGIGEEAGVGKKARFSRDTTVPRGKSVLGWGGEAKAILWSKKKGD